MTENQKVDTTLVKLIGYLQNAIKDSEFENHTFLVGGCVRDYLMDKPISDYDIVVDLPNGGVKLAQFLTKKDDSFNIASNPIIFGRYGTARFTLRNNEDFKHLCFDATQTRRTPSYLMDEDYNIEENVGTIIEDACLRDATINALYLDVTTAEVYNMVGGAEHIKQKLLKTPTTPDTVFKDDPLRMLRIIRFSTTYGFDIDKDTWLSIFKNSEMITQISKERIKEELSKILLADKPSIGIRKLMNCGLLYYILPHIYTLNNHNPNYALPPYYPNVFEHTLRVIDKTQAKLPNRLAALFHDVGKHFCAQFKNGKLKFPNYTYASGNIAEKVLKELRFPNDIINDVTFSIKMHDLFVSTKNVTDKRLRKFIAVAGDHFGTVIDLMMANAYTIDKECIENHTLILDRLLAILEEEAKEPKKLPVNGNDVMIYIGLDSGPILGKIMEKLKDLFYENPNMTKQDALTAAYEIYCNMVTSGELRDLFINNSE